MAEVLYYAIPFFVLLLVVEAFSFRYARDEDDLIGYDGDDTRTSLLLGIGNVVINVAWKLVVVALYASIYELTPLRLDPGNPLTWVLLFFADDLSYYWFHRSATRAASSGRATSSTTRAPTTTSRPRCGRPGCR